MSDNELKVGEELISIAEKVKYSKNMVDEAMHMFEATMTEFMNDYLGDNTTNEDTYVSYYLQNLSKLSDLYDKTYSYILYAFKQMNLKDEEIERMIEHSNEN